MDHTPVEMKEQICMILGSEKKLIQLLGPENNKSSFVSCQIKPYIFKFCFGLVGTASDICLTVLNVRGMLVPVCFCVYSGVAIFLCDVFH